MAISTFLLPQVIATIILAVVLLFSLKFKDVPEAKYFQAAILIGMSWAILYGLELNAVLLSDKVFFAKVRFLFLPFISLTYLLMAASHAGKTFWLSRKNILVLSIIPVLTVLVMLTSDYTHLFRYDFDVRDVGDFSVLTFTNGPWYWVHVSYQYLLSMLSVALLIGTMKSPRSIYSKQASILIFGTLVPTVIDLLFNLGITPVQGYNFASSTMAITGLFFFWALFSYHVLDIKPVARSEMVDRMSDLYLVVDAKGRLVDFNITAARKLGLEGGKGIGLEVRSILPAKAEFFEKLTGPADFTEELKGIVEGDMTIYEASVSVLSKPGSSGSKLLILRDITLRKKAEDELRLSEERYRELIDSSPFPITIARKDDGRLLFINQRAERHFKISKEEALSTNIQDYYEDPVRRTDVLREISEKGHLDDFEIIMKDMEGGTFWASTSAILVDYQGARAVFAEYNDISELKRLGAAIQSVNMKLKLLSTITRHDIRNDLMVIHGHIQLSQAETDISRLKGHLAKIKVAADRVDTMIEFTKTYQDLGNEPPGWYRVADMFNDAVNKLQATNITTMVSVGELKIFSDRLVERAFYNLLDNSVRHGGQVTQVKLEFHEDSSGGVLVYSDDGVGIEDSDRPRLFERGFGKNTGLGLFLTREILAITSISITERGKEGQGVRFEIRIPHNVYRARY